MKFSGHNIAIKIVVFFMVISTGGVFLLTSLTINLHPSQSFKGISISTYLSSGDGRVIDKEITGPIETAISTIDGVKDITSVSQDGSSVIRVELYENKQLDLFRLEASAVLRSVEARLPLGTSSPKLTPISTLDNQQKLAVLSFSISSDSSPMILPDFYNKELRPLLYSLKGIDKIEVLGVAKQRYHINISSQKLKASGLEFNNVVNQLQSYFFYSKNTVVPKFASLKAARLHSDIGNLDRLGTLPIANSGGTLLLNRIAELEKDFIPETSIFRINGKQVLTVNVFAKKGVNSIGLTEDIVEGMNDVVSKCKGFRIQINHNNSSVVKREITQALVRFVCAVVLLLLFIYLIYRNFVFLAVVSSALLANIFLSVIIFYFFEVEIHLYSIAGVTVALGLVIDNIVVAFEETVHRSTAGSNAAVIASSLLNILALGMVFFLPNELKVVLEDFCLVVSIILLISIVVVVIYVPAISHLCGDRLIFHRSEKKTRIKKASWYLVLIRSIVGHKKTVLFLALLIFGVPIFLLPVKLPKEFGIEKVYNATFGSQFYNENIRSSANRLLGGVSFLFLDHQNDLMFGDQEYSGKVALTIYISMQSGPPITEIDNICKKLESTLLLFEQQLTTITTRIDGARLASIEIKFRPDYEKVFPAQIKEFLEQEIINFGSAEFDIIGSGGMFSNSDGGSVTSSISIKGFNYEQLEKYASSIQQRLETNQRIHDITITSEQRKQGFLRTEYSFFLENKFEQSHFPESRSALSKFPREYGLTDIYIGDIQENTGVLPIYVIKSGEKMMDTWNFKNQIIEVSDSTSSKFKYLGELKSFKKSNRIKRINKEYNLLVNYQFDGSSEQDMIFRDQLLTEFNGRLPFGYKVTGNNSVSGLSNKDLSYFNMFLGVILIFYIASATLLQSLKQSLVVIALIPFSFIGVFLILYLFDIRMEIGFYAGLLMVAGLSVTTALYILNAYNFYNRKMVSSLSAFLAAIKSKLWPIILTATSSIVSLIPFLLFDNETSFWFVLSLSTIGGTIFTILGCLVFLPIFLITKNDL